MKQRIHLNIASNFASSIWAAILGIVCIPFYLQLLGVDNFGLIGFYLSLQAFMQMFDLGLGTTVNREMARLSISNQNSDNIRTTAKTLEIVSIGSGCVIGLIIVMLSKYLAYHWLHSASIPPSEIWISILLMGFILLLQWPINFYNSGLLGLQLQILLNSYQVCFTTLRMVGVIPVLYIFGAKINYFFSWNMMIAIISLLLLRALFWKHLPPSERKPIFCLSVVKNTWRFSLGSAFTKMLAIALGQVDKLLLSTMLNLKQFGYYMLAYTATIQIFRLIQPINDAFFPRFTNLIASHQWPELKKNYRIACQLSASLIIPLACFMSYYSTDILFVWTHNHEAVKNSHLLFSLLILAFSMNALYYLPNSLQLAFGYLRLNITINVLAFLFLAPAIYFSVVRYGAIGACWVWFVLYSCYLLIGIHFMHRKYLTDEKGTWYLHAFIKPLFLSGAALLLVSKYPIINSHCSWITEAITCFIIILTVSIFTAPDLRKYLIKFIDQKRKIFISSGV